MDDSVSGDIQAKIVQCLPAGGARVVRVRYPNLDWTRGLHR